jgi:hypothetical protein
MNLQSLFSDLEDLRLTSSRTDKSTILDAILDSENADLLKSISEFVFDPYRKVFVRVTEDLLYHASHDVDLSLGSDEEIWGQFVVLLRKLEHRSITGNEARQQVASFLVSVPGDYREWFIAILNKDLKVGVGRALIEQHIPDVAPKFEVQLCPSKQWDGFTVPDGGFFVSPKIDGIRGIIGPFGDEEQYVSLSRKGLPLCNTEHIVDELKGFAETFHRRNDVWPVFDGEFYTHGWELSSSITSTQSKHPEAHRLQYWVFDIITMPEWVRGRCKAELHFRNKLLANVLSYVSDSIIVVPSILSVDADEIQLISSSYVDEGFEGSVLKGSRSLYEFKRSKAWMKFKPFHDDDLLIVGLDYGYLDSNNNLYGEDDPRVDSSARRVVRSLIVERQGIKTNVGSGLSREQRVQFAENLPIGKVATIRYQRVSNDGVLIFPRMKGIRTDK